MTIMVMFVMTSCSKEEAVVDLQTENTTIESVFTPASADNDPNIDVEKMLSQIQEENENIEATTSDRCPCGVNSISDVYWGSLVNLNIKYDITPGSQVRVHHYVNSGNGYTYHGYDTIYLSGYSGQCANKGVNMSTGQVPSGQVCSFAGIYTPSSPSSSFTTSCGSLRGVVWQH